MSMATELDVVITDATGKTMSGRVMTVEGVIPPMDVICKKIGFDDAKDPIRVKFESIVYKRGSKRIDCKLGIELKQFRLSRQLTLMKMAKALNMPPSELSSYEHNIGALKDDGKASAIAEYCNRFHYKLSDDPISLSNTEVETDLTGFVTTLKKMLSDKES
ncbi:MAG: helix-turn-helix transcriptional regulator [Psychrobacter sp.]|nr:helix-turn-helix transcriptional regulator [Psychrobacter sp.]